MEMLFETTLEPMEPINLLYVMRANVQIIIRPIEKESCSINPVTICACVRFLKRYYMIRVLSKIAN